MISLNRFFYQICKIGGGLLGLLFILHSICPAPVTTAVRQDQTSQIAYSFKSSHHILGFTAQGVYAAGGSHALRVDFLGANQVQPQADAAASADNRAASLGSVTYSNLWKGITLVYERAGNSIYATTYTIAPGANPRQIRLRYNAPVALNENGALTIAFENGTFTESAPVAWQEVEGQRMPVKVGFSVRGREVSFALGNFDPGHMLYIDPSLVWNSFLGGSGYDLGEAISVDNSGNTYVAGTSDGAWGSPVRAYSGSYDAFVAKLNSSGSLVWNTFLGSGVDDLGWSILIDNNSGEIFVLGNSTATWGSPVRAYSSGRDIFVAKLNSSGGLLANTFLGGSGTDYGKSISNDSYGNLYISGNSNASWGTPQRAYSAGADGYVAKLSSALALSWNTFLGGSGYDRALDIDALSNYAIYIAGESSATWGSPVRSYSGDDDAFVALLDENGSLTWNTFLGGGNDDYGYGIVVPNAVSIYVTGYSLATWGSPVRTFTGSSFADAFAAKLNASGSLTWNTFLGGSAEEYGHDIGVDGSGNIYVVGESGASWGSPLRSYTSGGDAFAAKLSSSGALLANTFMGGSGWDRGNDIAVDGNRNVYLAGSSTATWENPVRGYSAGDDAFVTKVDLESPVVQSITLLSPNPTSDPTVLFQVNFSEAVKNVDIGDFGLYTTGGISFVSIANVSLAIGGTHALVTVNTGTGNGTIQLRVMGWANICDLADNLVSNIPYLSGPTYTVNKPALYLPLVLR
ncbi:MAG: SBBP repeat-containing protein [Chloroflexota bacterium]